MCSCKRDVRDDGAYTQVLLMNRDDVHCMAVDWGWSLHWSAHVDRMHRVIQTTVTATPRNVPPSHPFRAMRKSRRSPQILCRRMPRRRPENEATSTSPLSLRYPSARIVPRSPSHPTALVHGIAPLPSFTPSTLPLFTLGPSPPNLPARVVFGPALQRTGQHRFMR